jgi:hypothetical protein
VRAGRSILLSTVFLAGAAHAGSYAFIVSGLGGEPAYEKRFGDQARTVAAAAEKLTGDKTHVVTLSGAKADRESVRRELTTLAGKMKASDQVTIVLIGHGTFDGEEYRFNLPGPDLTSTELGQMFDRLPARDQLIVNATSASGAVIERWTRDNRVVITATKSGGERTATRFAEYWANAVAAGEADTNKDSVVTAAEAFEFTSRKVADYYKADSALATEHARLEGTNAGRFTVARLGAAAVVASSPEVDALMKQRAGIEQDLNAVKDRKPSLSQDAYYNELEAVLSRLASLQKQIDAKQAEAAAGAR